MAPSSKITSREDYPFGIDEQVRWGDLDAFQHVNNTVYFRFFESVRIKFFEYVGFDDPKKLNDIGPTLAFTECYFKRPLFYPSQLWVGTRIKDLTSSEFYMDYAVFAAQEDKPAAVGSGRIVCFDYGKQVKAELPQTIYTSIAILTDATT